MPASLPKYVTHLDMHDQGITMMNDDACISKEGLLEIILDSNQINGISEDAFHSCKELKHLKLSRNQIYQLEGGLFRTLSKLESIDLSDNQIEKIPDAAFAGMVEVERVDLRDNGIVAIGERAFEGLNSLRFLYLERNRLTTIDVNWIRQIGSFSTHLDIIFLNQNDINCDCKMAALGNQLRSTVNQDKGATTIRQIIKADSITCAWPRELSGQTLEEVDYTRLSCDASDALISATTTKTSHGSNFMLVLLGSMLSVVGYFGFLKFQRYRVQGMRVFFSRNNSNESKK